MINGIDRLFVRVICWLLGLEPTTQAAVRGARHTAEIHWIAEQHRTRRVFALVLLFLLCGWAAFAVFAL